jgi:hypothetical protein
MNRQRTIISIQAVVFAFFLITASVACSLGSGSVSTNNTSNTLSEKDYKAACLPIPIGELTNNADSKKGQLVKLTGQIVSFEETSGDDTITRIIIAVNDETNALPSGLLPVYIVFHGSISAFIYDNVTVYGEVYGNDDYQSPQIAKKTLPRVDAKYIEEVK